jgi:hypothetical protein
MADFAQLELTLRLLSDQNYALDMHYRAPSSDADVEPLQGRLAVVQLDFASLDQASYDLDRYSQLLTEGLFADERSRAALGQVQAASGETPVRVRLRIDPSAAELHRLRWETLRDPQTGSPLCTSERILFSRYLSSDDWRPVSPVPISELRTLAVVANPSNLPGYKLAPVDVEGELGRIRTALGDLPLITLPDDNSQRATLANLMAHLREKVDVLYLACHGTLRGDEPWLWLEDDAGRVARLSGSELILSLAGLEHLPRLIVLASCESAAPGQAGALSALGPRLSEIGTPAVLAMQGSISMETVTHFMPVFFAELNKDGQIDRAVAVARGAVRHRPDAWMPVLFCRLASGRIFPDTYAATSTAIQHQAADIFAEAAAHLATNRISQALTTLDKLEHVQPHYPGAAELRDRAQRARRWRRLLSLTAIALPIACVLFIAALFRRPSTCRDQTVVASGTVVASAAQSQAGQTLWWIGRVYQGLYTSQSSGALISFPDQALGNKTVQAIAVNPATDTAWVGTLTGELFELNPGTVLRRLTQADGLPGCYISALAVTTTQHVYIGTLDGNGLGYFDGNGPLMQIQPPDWPAGVSVSIFSLAADAEGAVWVGTQRGLYRYDGVNWRPYSSKWGNSLDVVTAVVTDNNDVKWVAIRDKGLAVLDDRSQANVPKWIYPVRTNLLSDTLSAMASLPEGDGVLVSAGKEVSLCRFKDNTRDPGCALFPVPGLSDLTIYSLAFDPDGHEVLIGTDQGPIWAPYDPEALSP